MTQRVLHLPDGWLMDRIHVVLAGVGGTGSEMLDGLLRLHQALVQLDHPGLHVMVYDPSEVKPTNIGRQRFYPGDEGQSKALLSVQRINIFHGLDWDAYDKAFTVDNCEGPIDLLISCVDKIAPRLEFEQLMEAPTDCPMLWLDTGNGDRTGQVVLGTNGQEVTPLPSVIDLFPELHNTREDDKPSCSFAEAIDAQDLLINRLVADASIDMLWQLFRKGKINHHGAFIEAAPTRINPLMIDPAVWASFGLDTQRPDQAA